MVFASGQKESEKRAAMTSNVKFCERIAKRQEAIELLSDCENAGQSNRDHYDYLSQRLVVLSDDG